MLLKGSAMLRTASQALSLGVSGFSWGPRTKRAYMLAKRFWQSVFAGGALEAGGGPGWPGVAGCGGFGTGQGLGLGSGLEPGACGSGASGSGAAAAREGVCAAGACFERHKTADASRRTPARRPDRTTRKGTGTLANVLMAVLLTRTPQRLRVGSAVFA